MTLVRVTGDGWCHSPVILAESGYERWRGLRGLPARSAMLLASSSVHGIGMRRAFLAVGITSHGVVKQVLAVRPGKIVSLSGCRYVLELPLDVTPPGPGTRLEVAHV